MHPRRKKWNINQFGDSPLASHSPKHRGSEDAYANPYPIQPTQEFISSYNQHHQHHQHHHHNANSIDNPNNPNAALSYNHPSHFHQQNSQDEERRHGSKSKKQRGRRNYIKHPQSPQSYQSYQSYQTEPQQQQQFQQHQTNSHSLTQLQKFQQLQQLQNEIRPRILKPDAQITGEPMQTMPPIRFAQETNANQNQPTRPNVQKASPHASGPSTFSNIRVNLRLRPLQVGPKGSLETRIDSLRIKDANRLEFSDPKGLLREYQYDHIFGDDASQLDVFENCGIINLLDRSLNDGYSGTILAYGQTGAGKTFTMEGKIHQTVVEGIIPRSARYVFRHKPLIEKQLSKNGVSAKIVVKASFLEIYNETCNDLLNINNGRNLPTRYNDQKKFYVENLFVIQCDSLDDLIMVIEEGIKNRKVAEHELNTNSSRSHSIFTLYFETHSTMNGFTTCRESKLNIVDLCGSEKLKKSNSKGKHQTETRYINKSLLTLGQVILSLSDPDKKAQHVRYRDSKLTSLLSDSLGGKSLCVMIANVCPSIQQIEETMNTLNYANKAKNIKNKPTQAKQGEDLLQEMLQLQEEVARLRSENEILKNLQRNPKPANPSPHIVDQLSPRRQKTIIDTKDHESPSNTRSTNREQQDLYTPLPSEQGSTETSSKSLFLRKNPLYPNSGIKNRPTKLKPIQRAPSDGDMNQGIQEQPHPPPPPQDYRKIGFQPSSRMGRIIAEGDRVEEEIRELKHKLEKIRLHGGDGITPRTDLVVSKPESSPVRRYRSASSRESENLELLEKIKELEDAFGVRLQRLEEENINLREILRQYENEKIIVLQAPPSLQVPIASEAASSTLSTVEDEETPLKENSEKSVINSRRQYHQRARRPLNAETPHLPALYASQVINQVQKQNVYESLNSDSLDALSIGDSKASVINTPERSSPVSSPHKSQDHPMEDMLQLQKSDTKDAIEVEPLPTANEEAGGILPCNEDLQTAPSGCAESIEGESVLVHENLPSNPTEEVNYDLYTESADGHMTVSNAENISGKDDVKERLTPEVPHVQNPLQP